MFMHSLDSCIQEMASIDSGPEESDSTTNIDSLPMECLEIILLSAYVLCFHIWFCDEKIILTELASVSKLWKLIMINDKFKRPLHLQMRRYFCQVYKRRTIMRSNRIFLIENVEPTFNLLQHLLVSELLTEEDLNDIESLSLRRDKSAELLMKMRSADNEACMSFVKCLRLDNQHMVADVIEHGGVTVKVRLRGVLSYVGLLHETRQMSMVELNKLYYRRQQPSTRISKVIYKLRQNDIEFLLARARGGGCELWLWCHSRRGVRQLQRKKLSGLFHLIDSLFTSFISSEHHWQRLMKKGLFVDTQQFDEEFVTCPIDTSLETRLHIERRNGAKALSVAELDNTIYILHESSDFYSVRVYENRTFHYEIPVESDFEPKTITACQKLQCLFLHCQNEYSRVGLERWCFWRISLPHGSEFEYWFGEAEQFQLQGNTSLNLVSFSVSEYGHLILLKYDKLISSLECQLDSYNCLPSLEPPELLSSIQLRIIDPHHAVETSNMTFIVSHGFLGESGILEISPDGDIIRQFAYLDAKNQSPIIAEPVYLTLASHDRLIVASKRNDSIIVVDSQLNLHETILTSRNHGIRGPTQICYFGKELLVLHNKYKNIDIFSLKNTTL